MATAKITQEETKRVKLGVSTKTIKEVRENLAYWKAQDKIITDTLKENVEVGSKLEADGIKITYNEVPGKEVVDYEGLVNSLLQMKIITQEAVDQYKYKKPSVKRLTLTLPKDE